MKNLEMKLTRIFRTIFSLHPDRHDDYEQAIEDARQIAEMCAGDAIAVFDEESMSFVMGEWL